MATFSGIYLHYEGTTAQCDARQQNRETVYDTDSGLFRYKTSGGSIVYIDGNFGTGTSGYLSMWGNGVLQDSDTRYIGDRLTTDSSLEVWGGSGLFAGNLYVAGDGDIDGDLEVDGDILVHGGVEFYGGPGPDYIWANGTALHIETTPDKPIYIPSGALYIGTNLYTIGSGLEIGIETGTNDVRTGLTLARGNTGAIGAGLGIGIDYVIEEATESYTDVGAKTFSQLNSDTQSCEYWIQTFEPFYGHLHQELVMKDDASHFAGAPFTFSGVLKLASVSNAATDTDKFLCVDGREIKYRTGAELASDIGAAAGTGTSGYLVQWGESNSLKDSNIYTDSSGIISASGTFDLLGNFSHGITSKLPSSAYARIDHMDSDQGGLSVIGATDGTAGSSYSPVNIEGILGVICNDGNFEPAINLIGSRKSGTSVTSLSDSDIVHFVNNSTTKLKVSSEGILDYTGTMGDGTDDPTTTAPTDWVEVKIGGATRYLPAYT